MRGLRFIVIGSVALLLGAHFFDRETPQSCGLGFTPNLSGINPDLQRAARPSGPVVAAEEPTPLERAADLALAAPPDERRDAVITAYHEWARRAPEAAFASAWRIGEPATRDGAVRAVFSGWSRLDPAGLAETALAFPEGDERQDALIKALRAWLHDDPERAGDWILAHDRAVAAAETMFRRDRR